MKLLQRKDMAEWQVLFDEHSVIWARSRHWTAWRPTLR